MCGVTPWGNCSLMYTSCPAPAAAAHSRAFQEVSPGIPPSREKPLACLIEVTGNDCNFELYESSLIMLADSHGLSWGNW